MARLIAFLALSTLTLTGCSNAPTNEFKSKLVEYEKCLEFAQMIQELDLENQVKSGNFSHDVSIETSIKDCQKYRP